MAAQPGPKSLTHSAARGFTLVELLITLVILAVVTVVLMAVMFGASRSRTATSNQIESVQAVRAGVDLMTRDLRSAGYGADLDYTPQPQPPIAYVDSMQVIINANLRPFPDNVSAHTPPLAYNPAGSPRPRPLDGTSYAPPIKYRTGAEVVRWTLDVNNDGKVDSDDLSAPDGADAQHTQNPGDFVLVRQVFGDSTGNVAGANGGTTERIALVDKPGGNVPAMFRVFFQDSANAWDWKHGPVPANKLVDIRSIQIQLTASGTRKNADGTYAQTTVRTQVATSRNVPDAGAQLFSIDGYVYNDKNRNRARDTGEPGISNAFLILGTMSTRTDVTGHYLFQVVAGTYRLKHFAPTGFGVFTSPDSTIIGVGPAKTFSFADTARAGGSANVIAFRDLDGDGYRDAGEPGEPSIKVSASPSGDFKYTDIGGQATLYLTTGAYTVTMTTPESLFATTPNPVVGTILNGDTVSVPFGLRGSAFGEVKGKVFRDVNKNGVSDGGEAGIANLWVGLTRDGGASVIAYATTDANGDYSIQAPINDPPRTAPYTVYITPPAGYFATTSTALSPVWVTDGGVTGNKNFGVFAFQLITLQAARVLSLANGDLLERDWPLNQQNSRARDLDLVLGSDANGSDQISAWFNRYDANPLFQSTPDYTRAASGSVLSLAVDTLDATGTNLSRDRFDVVAGTNWNASKLNWFVWINQGTTGNEGYLPASPTRAHYTKDKGDVRVVLTADLCGGSLPDAPDVLLGTATPGTGLGSVELWQHNNNNKNPEWAYVGIYPPDGSIPNDALGEVTAMALADFDEDGLRDLVVTAQITGGGPYGGQIVFFKNQGRQGATFRYMSASSLPSETPTSVAVADVDGDGLQDVVMGSQHGAASGRVSWWRNTVPSLFDFTRRDMVNAPGIVTSVAAADLGGGARKDIVVGYRTSGSGFGGGVRIYYTDLGSLSGTGVDPTGGAVVNFVPTITSGNFNYGVYPSAPYPPYLEDIAVGVKMSDTTGALVLIIR